MHQHAYGTLRGRRRHERALNACTCSKANSFVFFIKRNDINFDVLCHVPSQIGKACGQFVDEVRAVHYPIVTCEILDLAYAMAVIGGGTDGGWECATGWIRPTAVLRTFSAVVKVAHPLYLNLPFVS